MKKFLYETHSHSREASACAQWTIRESLAAHKEFGYTGLILTNHFFHGNTCVDRKLPWNEWVRAFCAPYNEGLETAEQLGMQLFFGWESCYEGTEFLIYGLDEQWLLEHPQIRDASIAEQFELVHEGGGLIIHPHPFREEDYIPQIRLFPEFVDGVECYNATHCSPKSLHHHGPEYDERAREYAGKHDFVMTAGSDSHHLPMLGGGMVFDRKLADIQDFICAVRDRECIQFLDGSLGADRFE